MRFYDQPLAKLITTNIKREQLFSFFSEIGVGGAGGGAGGEAEGGAGGVRVRGGRRGGRSRQRQVSNCILVNMLRNNTQQTG